MKSLSPPELKQWLNDKRDFLLIDVREDFERAAFNIGGFHIPFNEVMQRKNELNIEKPIVFYCEKGIRSALIIQRLEGLGFDNLYNLLGGMRVWKKKD